MNNQVEKNPLASQKDETSDSLPKKSSSFLKEKQPLRDGITREIFMGLVHRKREKNEHAISYSPFKIAIILLYFSGLQLKTIKTFTRENISQIEKSLQLEITDQKSKKKNRFFPQGI